MGVPFYVTCCFSHSAFNTLSLSLIFAFLIITFLGVALFGLIQFRTLWFLDLDVCFFSQVSEVFSYSFFKYVSCPFLSLFSFWDSYNVNVSRLDIFLGSLKWSSFLFFFFFLFFCSVSVISTTLSSSLLICSSVSSNLLLIPSRYFRLLLLLLFKLKYNCFTLVC